MKVARFVFRLFGINTYVVWDEGSRKAAIVDSGMSSKEEEEALKAFIARSKLTVVDLIDTHLHVDHACGNGFVIHEYSVKLSAHKGDEPLGAKIRQQAKAFMLDFVPREAEISTYLEDGDIVKIGDGRLKVLHVPGHSPGGIALYDAEGQFVLSGDSLFQGSIGRTDFEGGNHQQLVSAVRDKLLTLPDDTIVYPGHGDPSTIAIERQYNPFLR